ncbi:hypothetical protein [Microvirga sp. TS319]|uniref:hypothetical protein n=1 Tax=Microvirga sp. TS319 TaxID=3241165 RepID=UPI00351A5618
MTDLVGLQLSPDGEIVEPNLHDMELRGVDFSNPNDGIVLHIASSFSDAIRIEITGIKVLSLTTDHIQNVIYAAYVLSADLLLKKPYLASFVSDVLKFDLRGSQESFFVLEPASGICVVAQLKKNFSITITSERSS